MHFTFLLTLMIGYIIFLYKRYSLVEISFPAIFMKNSELYLCINKNERDCCCERVHCSSSNLMENLEFTVDHRNDSIISVVGHLRAAGRRAQFDNSLHHTNGLEVRGNLSSGYI